MVVDPGVRVSARISFMGRGAPAGLLKAWLEGRFDLIVSDKALSELESVLMRRKFRKYTSEQEVMEYTAFLKNKAAMLPDPESVPRATPDPTDDYLVALALSAADFLVSGNPHLTGFEDRRLRVLTPRAFLDLLLG